MKTKIYTSILLLLSVYISGNAQQTAITTTSKEISNNLDLKAVAYLFGKSHNLEHFEEEINSPHNAISNLDLNRDGYVDYLRVVETNMQNVHTVNIQAVLGNDIYKDIAMIGIQKDHYGKTHVRMIGNEHFYGYNYVLNPVYVNRPVIVANFWKPKHKAYHVSYHKHYPVHYKPRIVCTTHAYNKHLNYYATAYYNTNRPTVSYHYSVKPHHNNVKHYKYDNTTHHHNKYANNTSHTYSGKQTHNSQAKTHKQSNKQSHSATAKQHSRQNNTTVRYTNTTQQKVNTRGNSSSVKTASASSSRPTSTRSNTSTERKASNSRSEATTRTQQSRSTRSELAMR